MSRLLKFVNERVKTKLVEADDEAPTEDTGLDDMGGDTELDSTTDDTAMDDPGMGEEPVEGTEDAIENDIGATEDTANTNKLPDNNLTNPAKIEDFEGIDKTIENMVGVTDIQHTTSSTIIDFEDGGQLMYVQPMVSMKTETINEIISLIIKDVKQIYSYSKDEITGKKLIETKYWKSVEALVETMIRSQLTKSDNFNGLMDEIKEIFKVLEVK